MTYERDPEYLASLRDSRIDMAIKTNAARLQAARNGEFVYRHEPVVTSKERLQVFVPEALRRGMVISAEILELMEGDYAE